MVKTTVSSLLRFLDVAAKTQHVNEQDSTGKTILHHALSIHGNDIINDNQYFHVLDRLLCLPGLDKNIADHDGNTPLVMAIGHVMNSTTEKDKDFYLRVLNHLISHTDVRLNDYYLITKDKKQASPDAPSSPMSPYVGKRITLLMILACHWNHPNTSRIVDVLLRAGADPSKRVQTTSVDKLTQDEFRIVNRDLVRLGMAQGRLLKTAKDVMDQQRRLAALGQTQHQQSVYIDQFKARETVLDIARRFILHYLTFVYKQFGFHHRNISKNPLTLDPVHGDPNMVELLMASTISWDSLIKAIQAKGLKKEDAALIGLRSDMYRSIGQAYARRTKQLFLETLKTLFPQHRLYSHQFRHPAKQGVRETDEERFQQILKHLDTLSIEKQIKVLGLFLHHVQNVQNVQNIDPISMATMNRTLNTMMERQETSTQQSRTPESTLLLDNIVNAILMIKTLTNAKQTYQRSKLVNELHKGLKRKRLSQEQEPPRSFKLAKGADPSRSPRKSTIPIVKARRQIVSGIDSLPPDLHHQLIRLVKPQQIGSK